MAEEVETSERAEPGDEGAKEGEGKPAPMSRGVMLAILVAALGYFVDIYDLILFSVVRVKSVAALGIEGKGDTILEWQMTGMLIGGIVWGILGDRRGRLSVLFGSILLYSLSNIANGMVDTIAGAVGLAPLRTYEILRFVAGIGLAGELGAGITLVSEGMDKRMRGYGTTIVASVGICGAIVAVFVGRTFDWRIAYFVGGGMGIALLLLRIGVYESGMFERTKRATAVSRGNFFQLFWPLSRLKRYLGVILVGVPIWYVIGLLITFSDTFGAAMHMTETPEPAKAVLYAYIGLAVGDFSSGALSQLLGSRRRVLLGFVLLTAAFVVAYFTVAASSITLFYAVCGGLGFATGYWAVFVTVASEQFGTNIRATATTTAPNFVRGSLVLVSRGYKALVAPLGAVMAGALVGAVALTLALVALLFLEETHGKDLDFIEN